VCTLWLTLPVPLMLPARYKQQYASHAAHCSPPTKTGGGYWYMERARQAATSSSPFLGRTQYQADLLEGPATAAAQLASSSGVATTLVGYQAGRAKRCVCVGGGGGGWGGALARCAA
jgi:hypothetical protein